MNVLEATFPDLSKNFTLHILIFLQILLERQFELPYGTFTKTSNAEERKTRYFQQELRPRTRDQTEPSQQLSVQTGLSYTKLRSRLAERNRYSLNVKE